MDGVGLQTQTIRALDTLLQASSDKTNVAVSLLRKTIHADSALVATLLAPLDAKSQLDIRA